MTDKTNTDPAKELLEALPGTAGDLRREAFRALREGRPVEPVTISERTGIAPGEVREGLLGLADRGAVRIDDRGRVVAAGGLSLEPTRHRLRLSGEPLYTWCAIDAVGIPAALGEDAVAETACARCEAPIEIVVRAGRPLHANGFVAWFPHKEFSSIADDLCPEMNLFCDQAHLDAWRRAEGDPPGQALSIEEVARLGREWWTDASEEGPAACDCC